MANNDNTLLVMTSEAIERRIFLIRGKRVMVDRDLAELYGVSTKVLNQAVKRNEARFPKDFMFRLTRNEKNELVTKCDRFNALKHSTSLPYAFTEHGALMVSNVLKSDIAAQMSIEVVRAFVKLREMMATHKDLKHKIEDMEKKYDRQFKIVFDAIRQLIEPPEKPKRRIGFYAEKRGSLR